MKKIHPSVPHPNSLKKDVGNFNSSMVTIHAKILGSIGFIYFCYALEIVAFIALIIQTKQTLQAHGSVMTLISLWAVFIAQTFIQLVALPVLQNFQNRQTAQDEAKANADHEALTYLAQLQDEQMTILKALQGKNNG